MHDKMTAAVDVARTSSRRRVRVRNKDACVSAAWASRQAVLHSMLWSPLAAPTEGVDELIFPQEFFDAQNKALDPHKLEIGVKRNEASENILK